MRSEKKMHPVNIALSLFGLQLSRIDKNGNCLCDDEREFRNEYEHNYKIVENNKLQWTVLYIIFREES